MENIKFKIHITLNMDNTQMLVTSQFTNNKLRGLWLEYSGNVERSVTK